MQLPDFNLTKNEITSLPSSRLLSGFFYLLELILLELKDLNANLYSSAGFLSTSFYFVL